MADIQTIKSRISKMLATAADDASTPGEKATAMQMASALMRRYNLEREDIEDANKKENYDRQAVNSLWSRLTPWESTLASFVASYVVKGAYCITGSEGSSGRNTGSVGQAFISFVGLGDDASMAAATFTQLRDQLVRQCEAIYGTPVRGSGRSYAVGFVNGLFDTTKAAEEADKNDASLQSEIKTALIRTDMLKSQAKNWYLSSLGENFVVKSSNRKLGGIKSSAYNRGFTDGKNANTNVSKSTAGFLS